MPLVVGNTRDGALVRQVIGDHKLEAVIHFAAYKAAGESMTQSRQVLRQQRARQPATPEAACQAGVRKLRVLVDGGGLRHARDPAGGRETRLCARRIPTAKASSWSSRCSSGSTPATACAAWPCATSMLPARRWTASNGEDPRYVQNLIPLVMKVATGARARVTRVRHRLSHARWYRHPRLHPRARSGRSACPRLDFLAADGRRTSSNWGTGKGASVLEVLREARRASGVNIPAENTTRRPGY